MYKCDDEEIRKKIKEEQKRHRYHYVMGPKGEKGEKGDAGEIGPTGPRGNAGPTSIKIGNVETVSFDTNASITNSGTDEDLILDFKIPKGEKGEKGDKGDKGEKGDTGEKGIQGLTGEKGDKGDTGEKGEKGDTGPRGLPGETGRTEHISIDETETINPDEEAQVLDTFENMVHHLTFYIPKGEKGDKGDVGPTGPAGAQTKNPAGYESVLFVSFAQANYSKVMTFQENLDVNNVDCFTLDDNTNITLNKPGIYEITLCGQISGVDQSHGAIFYLSNTNGSVIQDLSFEVKAGTTTRMDCSETILTKIDTETTVYVRCGVIGDSSTANVSFENVNLIIKKYNA